MRDDAVTFSPAYADDFEDMFKAADEDKDGRLNEEQFCLFLNMRDQMHVKRYGGCIRYTDANHRWFYGFLNKISEPEGLSYEDMLTVHRIYWEAPPTEVSDSCSSDDSDQVFEPDQELTRAIIFVDEK